MKYFNRDLSWLSFNERVLQEAEDNSVPLFERIKFLGIFSSNLEEFFRVRISGLRYLTKLKKKNIRESGFDLHVLTIHLMQKIDELQNRFGNVFRNELLPALASENFFIKDENSVSESDINFLNDLFTEKIYPYLTPMIIVKKKIKPFLKTGQLYLSIKISSNDIINSNGKNKKFKYALMEIPSERMERFIKLPSEPDRFEYIFLDDVIRIFIKNIFKGYNIEEVRSIKLTRDAELYIEDEFSGNLLDKIKKNLGKRITGLPSRFLYDSKMSKPMLNFLSESLNIDNEDLVKGAKYHNFQDFLGFPFPDFRHCLYPEKEELKSKYIYKSENIFNTISKKDRLLHFPYESFSPVAEFINTAAEDNSVKSIKVTLYRVAKNSSIVNSLLKALKNGKHVTVFIEIKARFDEELNIINAGELQKAGANVLYSIPGIKVHAKLAMVTRIENEMPVNYCYLATGNFNEKTSRIYCDTGLFTSLKHITDEVSRIFEFLEGGIIDTEFKNLLVGQFNMKKEFLKLIDTEIKNAAKGKEASVTLKLNSLEDRKMIDKLYEASKTGVKIFVIVRGICCLVPGVKKQSSNIKIISIVDRYLEHSRVFVFHNGGDKKVYISSADWMKRNLNRRIETAIPVYDEDLKKELIDILDIQKRDNTKARIIDKDQKNEYVNSESADKYRAQSDIYNYLLDKISTE
ncbi:MAG: polyphosphate kinase 1 [Ignavibacteria bacterium]